MIVFNIFILLCLFLTCSNGWLGICDAFYIQWFVKFYFYNLYLDLLEFEINYNYNYIYVTTVTLLHQRIEVWMNMCISQGINLKTKLRNTKISVRSDNSR
jgi:hypothetical protein